MSATPQNSKREAACYGKQRFETPTLARLILRRWATPTNRRHDRRTNAQAYRCKYCGGWHIGRPSP